MKLKSLLLCFILLAGIMHARATEIYPGDPEKKILEITGSVIDSETGKPIKDVTITAYASSKKEKIVYSNETGKFGFDDLRSGIYKVVFEKDGYKKVVKEKLVIKTDETFLMQIEMIESSGYHFLPSPLQLIDTGF